MDLAMDDMLALEDIKRLVPALKQPLHWLEEAMLKKVSCIYVCMYVVT